jgi:hypothetical protein
MYDQLTANSTASVHTADHPRAQKDTHPSLRAGEPETEQKPSLSLLPLASIHHRPDLEESIGKTDERFPNDKNPKPDRDRDAQLRAMNYPRAGRYKMALGVICIPSIPIGRL